MPYISISSGSFCANAQHIFLLSVTTTTPLLAGILQFALK